MKYIVNLTRWEPFSLQMEIEATSRTAASFIAKDRAKLPTCKDAAEADSTTTPKVSIRSVRELP